MDMSISKHIMDMYRYIEISVYIHDIQMLELPDATGGALEVWQWTCGSRTAWLVNKSAGQPQFYGLIMYVH